MRLDTPDVLEHVAAVTAYRRHLEESVRPETHAAARPVSTVSTPVIGRTKLVPRRRIREAVVAEVPERGRSRKLAEDTMPVPPYARTARDVANRLRRKAWGATDNEGCLLDDTLFMRAAAAIGQLLRRLSRATVDPADRVEAAALMRATNELKAIVCQREAAGQAWVSTLKWRAAGVLRDLQNRVAIARGEIVRSRCPDLVAWYPRRQGPMGVRAPAVFLGGTMGTGDTKCDFCALAMPAECMAMDAAYDECPLEERTDLAWRVGLALHRHRSARQGLRQALDEIDLDVTVELVETLGQIALDAAGA